MSRTIKNKPSKKDNISTSFSKSKTKTKTKTKSKTKSKKNKGNKKKLTSRRYNKPKRISLKISEIKRGQTGGSILPEVTNIGDALTSESSSFFSNYYSGTTTSDVSPFPWEQPL